MISLSASGVRHVVGKLSMKDTTLLETSFPSKVYTQSYEAPKSKESYFGNFGSPI